nr:LicD family protein [uncultured Blautia sp.]
MTEKQEHLLRLFQELDHICKENELRYVLAEESALAAAGRARFAGGETEIKVYMPRADWNRLGEMAKKELPKDRVLYQEPGAGYGEDFGCALEKKQILGTDPAGERIHILVLDPVPEEACEKYRKDLGMYLDLADPQEVLGQSWGISPSRYYRYYLSTRFTGKKHVLGNLEKRMQAFREEDCSKYAVHVDERLLFLEKDVLFPGKNCDFQGVQAMIPGKITEYLTCVYGDEWPEFTFTSKEDEKETATVEGISYQELREDYLPGIRKGRLQRAVMHSKLRALSGEKTRQKEEKKLTEKEKKLTGEEQTFSEEDQALSENGTGAELKKDLEQFRQAIAQYADGQKASAKETAIALYEKYPDHPLITKFLSRFYMEEARESRDSTEAERFIEEALRKFPEDGYFLKYRGELLWMRGRCADALVVFAQARENTKNMIVQKELDQFLMPYEQQTGDTCQALLANREKEAARNLAELWLRLLPRSERMKSLVYLTRVSTARTVKEMELLTDELTAFVQIQEKSRRQKNRELYGPALTKAWERLGYPGELAKLRTEILYTEEPGELEWIAEKVRDYQIHKDKLAQVYKLAGDARKKQGQTAQAFENYRKAMEYAGKSYARKELSSLILQDLYMGSHKMAEYVASGKGEEFLDAWLSKYGTVEDLKKLVRSCVADGSISHAGDRTPLTGEEWQTMEETKESKEDYATWCWDYVQFCAEKIRLEKYYTDHKDYIVNLYKNKDYPRLESFLAPYHRATLQSLKTQEIFVPDEEIFEIYLHILECKGMEPLKKEIENYWN